MTSTNEIRARFNLTYPEFCLDVDLHLPGRGITALFGASGSGKTTLLRCIAGLQHVANGVLQVNGAEWQAEGRFVPTHQRALGYVFQEASLFPHLSVRGNLQYGMQRVAVADSKVAYERTIELLGIAHLLDRRPEKLSGGERQRVAIARALLSSPRLLLLDEPLAALDAARKQEILPYLEKLHDELDIPVLYVSHSVDEVARLADHLVVLDKGRVLAVGKLTETLARLELPMQLGDDAGVVLEGTIAARDMQWHLARVHCAGVDFWVRDGGHAPGDTVRIRILAKDVSIALREAHDTSILNIVPARVSEINADAHPAQSLIKLRMGESPLLARITQRSLTTLGLVAGKQVFAQIKAVALIA